MYVFFSKILGEFLAVQLVEVLAGIGELIGTGNHQGIVGVVDDSLQMGHLHGVNLRGHMVAHEEQLGIGVIDDVVNLVAKELMKDGNSHSTVGQGGEESYGPLAGVASAQCNLVTFHHTAVLEQDVQLFNLTCYVVVLQGSTLIVSQCIKIPVVDDALLYQLVKTGYVFHIVIIYISIV